MSALMIINLAIYGFVVLVGAEIIRDIVLTIMNRKNDKASGSRYWDIDARVA